MRSARPPEEVLRRVQRLSSVNGWSVSIVAAAGAAVSLSMADLAGGIAGLLVALGGAIEVGGSRMLERRDPKGMVRLACSQLVVLGTIVVYALAQTWRMSAAYLQAHVMPELRSMLATCGFDLDRALSDCGMNPQGMAALLRVWLVALYGAVIIAALIYQGGLYAYYRRRTAAVNEALGMPPVIPGVNSSH